MIKFANQSEATEKLAAAMKSGDETKIQEAWNEFHGSVVEQVKADFAELQESKDTAVLAQRG
jgi:hypothetical protein